eukprot:g13660.t1
MRKLYGFVFRGGGSVADIGFGSAVITDDRIEGGDVGNGRYDGEVSVAGDQATLRLTLSTDSSAQLVTGDVIQAGQRVPIDPFTLSLTQPQQVATLTVGGKPVQVDFRFIRDLTG